MEGNSAIYVAVALSFKVALVATLLTLPLGFLGAYVLSCHSFRGKLFLELLVNLPLTLPPVVVGYGLLLFLGQGHGLGAWLNSLGVKILFTWKAAVIASMVVGFPLLVRAIRVSLESVDPRLLQTARVLGADRWDLIPSVLLPLSLRGILAGAALMFARSLGEFGATVIVAGNIPGVTQTLPLAIFDYANTPHGEGVALGLCSISVALSLIVLAGHEWLTRRMLKRV